VCSGCGEMAWPCVEAMVGLSASELSEGQAGAECTQIHVAEWR
jgi:hypothetical protein